MMKKILTLLLSSILIFSSVLIASATEETTANDSAEASTEVMPKAAELRETAPAPDYSGKVTFVGQWVGESSNKKDTERNFTSASDKLGAPEANGGLLRGLAKTFLAWSDQPAVDNGHLRPERDIFLLRTQ